MGVDASGFLLFVLAIGLTAIASRTSYYPMKFVAGLSWWGLAFFWHYNLPTSVAMGSIVDVIIWTLLMGLGLAVGMMAFWYTQEENGRIIRAKIRLPFMKTFEQEDADRQARYRPSIQERNRTYRERVNGALNGEVRRRG